MSTLLNSPNHQGSLATSTTPDVKVKDMEPSTTKPSSPSSSADQEPKPNPAPSHSHHHSSSTAVNNWAAQTKNSWSLFRNFPLCRPCLESGLGADPPTNLMPAQPSWYEGRLVDFLGWTWVSCGSLSAIGPTAPGGGDAGRCAFCTALYLGFRQLERAQYGPAVEPSGDWRLRHAFRGTQCVRVAATHWADGDGEVEEEFYVTVEGVPGGGCGILDSSPVPDDGRFGIAPAWIDFMRTRLRGCLLGDGHDGCRRKPDIKVEWPRRMLRIIGDVASLVDFHDGLAGEYAALSYCWGSKDELQHNPPVVATASTVDGLRSGIPMSALPLTVRQAMAVCSWLDIEYIWVDALCIMQDDKADWENEARKMATVYSLAKVTIIAASSTSCHSGFGQVRLGGEPLPLPFELPFRLVARRSSTSSFHYAPQDEDAQVEPSDPIDHRGWTFQEEFLSTRYIKFTNDDIQWQCREDAACLCQQRVRKFERRALYENLWEVIEPPRRHGPLVTRPREPEVSFCKAGRDNWHEIVRDFNRRKFTAATDKLLALSGLARKVAPNMQSPLVDSAYMAGMWKNMLLDGGSLLWRGYQSSRGRPSDSYLAPSFSWASIMAGVVYDEGSTGRFGFMVKDRLFEMAAADRVLVSPGDEFGRVSAGFLTLSGPLLPCIVRYGWMKCPQVVSTPEVRFRPRDDHSWFDCGLSQTTLASGETTLQRSEDNLVFEATGAHILLLRAISFYDTESDGFEGLVLGRDVGGRDGYQRLGCVRISEHGAQQLEMAMYNAVVTIY